MHDEIFIFVIAADSFRPFKGVTIKDLHSGRVEEGELYEITLLVLLEVFEEKKKWWALNRTIYFCGRWVGRENIEKPSSQQQTSF